MLLDTPWRRHTESQCVRDLSGAPDAFLRTE
jgi:hypothetical protein